MSYGAPVDLRGMNASALRKVLVPPTIPDTEVQGRTHYGRSLDMRRIESALLSAEVGMMSDLCDMERECLGLDPHLSGIVGKRFGHVASLDWDITAAQGGEIDKKLANEIADGVRLQLSLLPCFSERLYDLAWGAFDGRSALEIHWTQQAGGPMKYWTTDLGWVHPRRLSFGPEREVRLIEPMREPGYFRPLHRDEGLVLRDYPGKFLTWCPRMFSDYQEREGLGPRMLYWTFFKRFSWRMRMQLTELFGIPWRIVEIDKEASVTPEGISQTADKVEQLGTDSTAVLDPGMKLTVPFPGENSGNLFRMTNEEVDLQMSKLVLWNVGTTDAVANRAESVVQKGEQDLVLKRDGAGISGAVQQQLVAAIVALNWGIDALDHMPKFQLRTDPPRDRKAELDRVSVVIGWGVPVPVSEVREMAGVREPEPDEPYIVGAPGGRDAFGNPMPLQVQVIDPNAPPAPVASPPMPNQPGPSGNPGKQAPGTAAAAEEDEDETAEDDYEAEGTDGQKKRAKLELTAPELPTVELPMGPYEDFAACVADMKSKGHDDESAHRICGALKEKVEGKQVVMARQPHGAAESIVQRAVVEGARLTGRIANTIAETVPETDDPLAIRRALDKASVDLEPLSQAIYRTMLRSLMLGALDADWEAENDEAVKPDAFERATAERGQVLLSFTTVPFTEALKQFRERSVLSRREFDRLTGGLKRKAFTFAGAANTQMLETAKDELTKAIAAGADLRTFRAQLGERFESAGWTPLNRSHVETIFRNNVMGAYSSGRVAQMTQPAVLAARPYWQIMGVSDARSRPAHKRALNKVLRADDPFWKKAKPPFGHMCRCRMVSRSAADVERLGLTVVSGASLTGLPDDGWDGSESLLD